MKSGLCKVLHPLAGRPMISYVIDAVHDAGFQRLVIVTGHQGDEVVKAVCGNGIEFVVQEPQLGTGHAVAAANKVLADFPGHILIMCGDTPLIESATLADFLRFHETRESRLTVMTARLSDPRGYGRIVKNEDDSINRIVEERDATEEEKRVREINTGIYLADASLTFSLLQRIRPDNAQGEYYLTDIVREAARDGVPVQAFVMGNPDESSGINSRADLARVSAVVWNKRREELMASGVTLQDPSTVYVDAQVRIGRDTVIYPGVTISGETEIGSGCVIESGVMIIDSTLGDGVRVLIGSRLEKAVVGDGTSVGPMAHLRPGADIGKNARIGNYVEVKKSVVGDGTKASHLTYLGDSTIGKNVNIGCGTITCNYDGVHKHPTVIGDECFVGSDVQFVAPVRIGPGSLIGAGSTITRDVPARHLAVTRSRQRMFPLRKGQGSNSTDEDRES